MAFILVAALLLCKSLLPWLIASILLTTFLNIAWQSSALTILILIEVLSLTAFMVLSTTPAQAFFGPLGALVVIVFIVGEASLGLMALTKASRAQQRERALFSPLKLNKL